MNNKKLVTSIAAAAICLILTACGQTPNEVTLVEEAVSDTIVAEEAEGVVEPVIDLTNEDSQSKEQVELLAEIADHNISLYGKTESGVLIQIGDKKYEYDWTYITPRLVYPVMELFDYDEDGNDELAIILSVGSGTGVALDELRMLEINKDKSAEQAILDYHFDSSAYRAIIDELVHFKVTTVNKEPYGEIKIGNDTVSLSLLPFISEDSGSINEQLIYGDIIRFSIEEFKLRMEIGVGITTEKVPMPIYFGSIFGDVKYKDGGFELVNLTLEKII